jgi:hypothetical protein
MQRANDRAAVVSGQPVVFCHQDNTNADAGRVWILWAAADTGEAELALPCIRDQVRSVLVDGTETVLTSSNATVRVRLRGDTKMAPPILLLDRAN